MSKFGDLSSETFSSFVLIKSRLDAGLLPASFRPMIPVAVFDSKSYDREYLSKASEGLDLSFLTNGYQPGRPRWPAIVAQSASL